MQYKAILLHFRRFGVLKDGKTMPERLGITEDRLKEIISACTDAQRCAYDPNETGMTQADVFLRAMNEVQPRSIQEAVFLGYVSAETERAFEKTCAMDKLF